MGKKHTLEEAKEIFASAGLILLEEEYKNNKIKMRCFCPKHPDKEIWLRLNDIISGHSCPYCSIESRSEKRKIPFSEVKKCFENMGYLLLSKESDYKNSCSKLLFVCPLHPDIIQEKTYGSIRGGHGCKLCADYQNGVNQRLDFEIVQKSFLERGYTLLSTKEQYINSSTKLQYICPKHPNEIQEISWTNFRSGHGCRYCGSQNSQGENYIANFLKQNNIIFERQKRFPDLRNPKTGYMLYYDFYLPDYNLFIEYQGGYHDGKVHERNPKKQTIEQLEDLQNRDAIKKQYALDHNINFLEIWYWDFKNIEQILRKELGLIEFSVSGPSLDSMAV